MKLRIKDNSLRFRLLRGEVRTLVESGRVEAHTCFGSSGEGDRLSYILEHTAEAHLMRAMRSSNEIRVTVPTRDALHWANSEQVGIYGTQPVCGVQMLEIAVEKDFACMDGSAADNLDTFANPNDSSC